MFDEPFAHGRSLVHAVDPRFRLVAAFVCAVCLAVVRTPEAAWFGFGIAALLLALSRPPMRPVLRRLAVVNVFIAFLWLTVPLTSGGEAIAAWGPLEVSRAGVLLTLLVTVKSNAIVMTFLALVATMDSPTIGYALERLRFPSKLVFLFLFTYRYLHVIADEWHKLHGAAARVRAQDQHAYVPYLRQHARHGLCAQLRPFRAGLRSHDPARLFRAFSVRDRFPGHIPRCRVRRGGVRVHGLPRGL